MSKGKSVLQEAHEIVSGPRQQAYGSPSVNFDRIARMWSVILSAEVTPRQVGLCQAAVKICRDVHKPQRENLVDIAGYAGATSLLDE